MGMKIYHSVEEIQTNELNSVFFSFFFLKFVKACLTGGNVVICKQKTEIEFLHFRRS